MSFTSLSTFNPNNAPKSLCEAFLQSNIVTKNPHGKYSEKRKAEIKKIIYFISTHDKAMHHERDFKRLLTIKTPTEFMQNFDDLRTKILSQSIIFQNQFKKSKYNQIATKFNTINHDNQISMNYSTRINHLVSELIAEINNIQAFSTFKEMINYRVQVGTQCILESSYAKKILLSNDEKKRSKFFKNITKNIFKEECMLYQQFCQKFPNDEGVKSEGSKKYSQEITEITKNTHLNYLGTANLRTSSLYRGFSKMKLKTSDRPIDIGDIVMYPSSKNKNRTFFGRILEINDDKITIRNLKGKERIKSRHEIIQQF